MATNVIFKQGTRAQFDNLKSFDANALYFILDDEKRFSLYLADANADDNGKTASVRSLSCIRVINDITDLPENAEDHDGEIFYIKEVNGLYTPVKDENDNWSWEPVAGDNGTGNVDIGTQNNEDTGELEIVLKDKETGEVISTTPIGDEIREAAKEVLGDLQPMSYKGTVSCKTPDDGSNRLLPTTGVKSGDTYKCSDNYKDVANGISAAKGDLFIAVVDENGDITWEVVPSGDDADKDTQYFLSTTNTSDSSVSIKLQESVPSGAAERVVSTVKLECDDGSVQFSGSNKTIKISSNGSGSSGDFVLRWQMLEDDEEVGG